MPKIVDKTLQSTKTPDFVLEIGKRWNSRQLSSDDADEIQSFIRLFDDFFLLCEGEKGSVAGILNACPHSKNIDSDKFVSGLYEGPALIGLVDIIRDYPNNGVWTIGHFLIHPEHQSHGLGRKFISNLAKALSPCKLRCIVQKQNIRALNFWKSSGFEISSITTHSSGKLENVIYVLEK